MSSRKEEKGAADKIKATALLAAAKGMSRVQAERAATAAARNVNAYGQKEEGPSLWQEKKEKKRIMYAMSNEKHVNLGERKGKTSNALSSGVPCQKCLQLGHWTYECKNDRVYVSRPSRTQALKNAKLRREIIPTPYPWDISKENGDVQKEQYRSAKKGTQKKSKTKHCSDTESSIGHCSSDGSALSDSSSSESSQDRGRKRKSNKKQKGSRKKYISSSSSSDSTSSSDGRALSDSSSSESSQDRGRKRKSNKKQKGSRKKYISSSSSESSEYDSSSDSDSDSDSRRSRKKSKNANKHSHKH